MVLAVVADAREQEAGEVAQHRPLQDPTSLPQWMVSLRVPLLVHLLVFLCLSLCLVLFVFFNYFHSLHVFIHPFINSSFHPLQGQLVSTEHSGEFLPDGRIRLCLQQALQQHQGSTHFLLFVWFFCIYN